MRSWQIVCVAAAAAVAMAGPVRVQGGQILKYSEQRHSRSEAGVPGTNVTGGWSWVDHLGQRHHIWYIADTGGFRAFGDVVPQATALPMPIGVPVVVTIPLLPTQETAPKGPSNSQPQEKKTVEHIVTSESTHTGDLDTTAGAAVDSASVITEPEESTLPSVLNPDTDTAAEQNPDDPLSDGITEGPNIPLSQGEEEDIAVSTPPTATPTDPLEVTSEVPVTSTTQSARAHPYAEPLIAPPTVEEKSHGQPKSLTLPESPSPEGKLMDHFPDSNFHSAKPSPVTPSDNNFVATVFSKLSTVLGASADNLQKPTSPSLQETKNEIKSTSTSEAEPKRISDFVLINRLRAPNVPKTRVGSQQLVPKLVNVMGRADTVVMGLHSSGKPSTRRRPTHVSDILEPLGIHLLNRVPLPHKNTVTNRPVPQPVRVVGEPNLENFWLPARLARTTASPFRQPSPSLDYDYQYYDYYDYTDFMGDNAGGPVNPTHKVKTKTVRSNSEEYSLETDYPDSEESEDCTDKQ